MGAGTSKEQQNQNSNGHINGNVHINGSYDSVGMNGNGHEYGYGNNNGNGYLGNSYDESYEDEDEYDDECTNMVQSLPCFSLFCPPGVAGRSNSNSSGSNSFTHGHGSGMASRSGSGNYSHKEHNGHNGHNGNSKRGRRRRRNKSHGNHKDNNNSYDAMGTPLPDTPNQMRQRRAAAAYGGLYNGLEVEDQNQNHNTMQGNGHGHGHGQQHYNMHPNPAHSKAQIQEQYHNQYQYQSNNNNNTNNNSNNNKDGEREFMKKYQMSEVLGVGSTSICHRCINRTNGKSFACKIIDKIQIEQRFSGMMDQFHSEIDALRKLNHPNIIQLYDVFSTNKKIYIVMELMAGGELFDYVVQKGTLTEAEASVIVRMVTSALVYMHSCNIIHRDLKPENLLLKYKPNSIYDLEVKIIDFGLSKSMKHENMAQTFLGTRGYLAPEMLQRRQYSRAVDTWALGVIVFVLLCGCLPFDDDSSTILSDEAIKSKFTLRFPRWARNLSPSAKDLLSKLLNTNATTRYTAEEALRHPWICGTTAPKDSMLHSPGRIMLTPGKKSNPKNVAAANRTQMNEMIKNRARANSLTRNRARANSLTRPQRQLVRKKSI